MAIAVLVPSASEVESHLTIGLELARRMDESLIAICIAPLKLPSNTGSESTPKSERKSASPEDVAEENHSEVAKRQFQIRASYRNAVQKSLDLLAAKTGYESISVQVIEVPNARAEIVSLLKQPVGENEDEIIRTLVIPVVRGITGDQTWQPASRLFEVAQCQTVLISVAPDVAGSLPFKKVVLAGDNRHDINVARQFARCLNPEVIVETEVTTEMPEFRSMVIGIPGRAGQTNIDHCTAWNEFRRDENWDVVVLVNPADSWLDRSLTAVDDKIRHLFRDYQMPRNQRKTLSEKLFKGAAPSAEFVLFMSLATFLACIGLIQNSAAVIIGAMLVAPLMTPLLSAGLAMLFGYDKLFRQAVRAIVIGVAISFMIGFLLGNITLILPSWLFSGNGLHLTNEMIARSQPNLLDPFIGLAAGLAGGFAIGRDGQIGAVAGVAIAAALVPPIATAGLEAALISHVCWMEGSVMVIGSLMGSDPAPLLLQHGLIKSEHLSTVNVRLILAPILLFALNACAAIIGANAGLRIVGMHRGRRPKKSKRWVAVAFFVLLLIIMFLMLFPFITLSPIPG